MFSTCTSLQYIKCLATDWSASGSHTNMFRFCTNTNETTFVKAHGANVPIGGNDGIPTNWQIIEES